MTAPGWYWARRRTGGEPSRGLDGKDPSTDRSAPVIVRVDTLLVEGANLSILATVERFHVDYELGPRIEPPEGW